MANPVFVKTTDSYIAALMKVTLNAATGNTYLNQFRNFVTENGGGTTGLQKLGSALANYASTDNAAFAATVVANLGITGDSATAAKTNVTALLNSYGADRGKALMQLVDVMVNLQADATWGTAANAFVNSVNTGHAYSINAANTSTDLTVLSAVMGVTNGAVTGQNFTLTTGQDVFNGNAGADIIRGVAGQPVANQDQTTLNSSDILDGAAGEDALVVLLNGNYGGGATIKNIETLQIGTNQAAPAAAVSFDYNVNAGVYEVTGVNKVVYDQITTGETLNVVNVTPSATGTVAPTLSWENEAGSRAGTISVTYRQATIAGAADNQKVNLQNINAMNAGDGVLNIAGGDETITINSAGTVANNTLNNSGNADTGANAVAADVISAGTLSKVVLTGSVAIGKAAGVVTDTTGARAAFIGQTDRAVGNDMGLTADATTNATESNLLSVGARVTEVDASAMTGSANVRFVAKNDGTATNVTFKGGEAADYVEFEVGNINATGGKGDDTFSFINAQANSTLGEGDSIDGGEGADTIQIGVNGNAQTYNISETELRNKSSVGTIDLRGQTSNLTLSSDFVAKADTANSVTVRTDKIVQSSATDSLNPVNGANNGLENAAVSTVNLTKLSANQGVNFLGGSGSDRIILNDATFNVLQKIDGGVYSDAAAIGAGTARYDTITVVTNGENVVIDAQDLSNVKNVEGLVLTKNSASATYNITLTQAFLNNNTQSTDNTNTAIVDTNFVIGTAAAANNSALSGTNDVVRIDVRDLLNATDTARATGFTVRTFDVTSLENANTTIQFIGNTGNLTLAQVRALGIAVANGASANAADVIASGATVAAAAALTFSGTSADESYTVTAAADSINMAAGTDTTNVNAGLVLTGTLDGGTGTDTLSLGAAASISGATVSNYETLTLNGAATMTAAQYNAFTTINAAGGADAVTLTTTANVTGVAAVETYNLSATGNQITLAGAATQAINGNAAAVNDIVVTTGANAANKTIALGAGTVDTLTFTTTFAADWTLAAAGAAGSTVTGVEVVNLQAGLINGAAGLTMFNGAATVNLTSAAGQAGELVLGTGGQTVVVTGNTSGAYTVTGNTGADSVDLTNVGAAGGAITFGTAGLITALDTITGFRAGTDKIDTATGNTGALTALNIATASTADFASAVATAINANAAVTAANYNAVGDAYMITIAAGTAAGTYLVVNEGATNAVFTATEDVVVKLVGTVGTITAADII